MTRLVSVVALLVVATGCGFHLRGTGLETSIESAEVREVGHAPVSRELTRLLRSAGVKIIEDGSASMVIELLGQKEDRRSVSVTDRARTAEYELSLDVRFRARGEAGAEVIPERVAHVERVYRLDSNNIVGSHEQEALVRTEMEREVVRQIVAALEAATRARAQANAGQAG
jgi:LPS-assembly lipoprotein